MTNAPDTPIRKAFRIPDNIYSDRLWSGNDVRYQASRVHLIGEGPGQALIRQMEVMSGAEEASLSRSSQ